MQSQKREKESKMAKKKKKYGARSAKRRAALRGFAKGKFQSPVHSNGFKQDQLIDIYQGGRNFTGDFSARAAVGNAARLSGSEYLKFNDTVYKLGTGSFRGSLYTTFASDDKPGRVK